MKKSKILLVFAFVMVCMLAVSPLKAVEQYDFKAEEGVYKVSDDASKFILPFFRASTERMEIDRAISQVGFLGTNSSVEIKAPMEKVQVICANDTVRINSDMDYAIICANGNVIINANVDTLLVFSSAGIVVGEEGNVEGTLMAYTTSLEINGNVKGNVIGSADKVTVNAPIDGTLRIETDNISFADEVTVTGGVQVETFNNKLEIPESVGETNIEVKTEEEVKTVSFKEKFQDGFRKLLYAIFADLVIFLLFVIFVKKDKQDKLLGNIVKQPVLKKGLLGLVGIMVTFSFSILMLFIVPKVSVAGLIFAIGSIIIAGNLKNAVTGIVLSKMIEDKYKDTDVKLPRFVSALVSFVFIELVQLIPFIGGVISFIVEILAIGIVVSIFKKDEIENIEEKTIEVKE